MPEATATVSTKTPVTMSDGTVVEFNKKQKLVKTSTINADGSISLRLDFVNGETRNFTPRSDMIPRFAAHGAEQKLGDAIAGETDVGDAVLAMDDLIARLDTGEWGVTRSAGAFAGTSILIRALVEASGKDVAAIKEFLVNKLQAEKLALRRSTKLQPIIQRLEAEKSSNSKTVVDTDSLLGELGLADANPAPSKKVKENA